MLCGRCRRLLLILAGAALAVAARGEGEPYRVGPGDSLDIRVGGETELSGLFPVSPEGSIVYPLLGAVRVAGLDVPAIASLIRTRLDADFLVNPQVAVYVKEYNSQRIAVLGDVPSPGIFPLKADSTLLSVLAEAGLKLAGGETTIIVTRSPEAAGAALAEAPLVLKLDEVLNPWQEQAGVRLRDRDRIFVKSGAAGKVIVSGKVNRPGVIPLTEGMSVMEAINKAGGVAEFGSLKGVRVVRENKEGSEVMTVNLEDVIAGDRSKDILVQAGDIVVVPRRWF